MSGPPGALGVNELRVTGTGSEIGVGPAISNRVGSEHDSCANCPIESCLWPSGR